MDKKGKSGFRVPEDYFDDFPARLEQRLKQPGSASWPEESGFRVPEGYFDQLGDRISERVGREPARVRKLWSGRLGWAAAAAAAIVILLTFRPGESGNTLAFEDLAGLEIQQYLEDGQDDLDAYELAETLPLEDIAIGDMLEAIPEDDQILDYLNQDAENVDELYWESDE